MADYSHREVSADDPLRVVFVHGSLGLGGAEVLRMSVLEELIKDRSVSLRVCVLRKRGELADLSLIHI